MKSDKAIEILVRGVCVKAGKLLVCQSKGSANTYLPGGHVEWNEQAEVALKREIKEELGVKSVVKDFLGAVEHTFIQKGKRHCEINLVFTMAIPELSPKNSPEACEDWIRFKWIPLSALGRNHLEPWPLRKMMAGLLKAPDKVTRWGSTLRWRHGDPVESAGMREGAIGVTHEAIRSFNAGCIRQIDPADASTQ